MTASLFTSSKLKIKRADQHVSELNSILQSFLNTDFYRLHIEKNPQDGLNVLKFEATRDMPCEVPLIMGDAIHNLRAALDLMACEIVTLAGDMPDRYINFPFQTDRNQLIATINGGKIKAAPPAIIDLIVDTIKPYKGGDDVLYAMNDLDIMDKHRLLIPVVAVTAITDVNMSDECGNTFHFRTIAVGHGGKLNLVGTPTNIKITKQGNPAFDVFFDKGQVFEGKSVIPTLHQLSQLVSSIVQTIEKAYLALSKNP